jgi:predicted aconitase
VGVRLTDGDQAYLAGDHGSSAQSAMRIVVRLADTMEAEGLLDITGAHIDSCLYHGPAVLDFADWLADGGARVAVPTTLNVSSLDLLHPDLYRGDPDWAVQARRLMERYEEMGCRPTWTCAPYQLDIRPSFGEQIAWAESNAIVFANSVLGARTHRYGDFIDICAAICGRAPAAGLHLDENRRGTLLVRLEGLGDDLLNRDVFYPVLGYLVGQTAGHGVPVIDGLPPSVAEDRLKALGAAAASAGSVGLFHAVGSTPEAPTVEAAFQGVEPERVVVVSTAELRVARDALSTTGDSRLGTVSLGTPHYSVAEISRLVELLDGRSVHPDVSFYVSTGRDVLAEVGLRGWEESLRSAGVTFVTDTCTYITPILAETSRPAMTDSGKWAYYAPGNLGVEVVFGSVEDCVASAVAGEVVRDDGIWGDG